MNYEQLLTAADQEGLLVKEQPLTEHDGLIRGSRIAIRKDIETQAEKSCVLAEEIGHYRTSSGNILDQLLTAADQEGLLVKEQPLTRHDGLIRAYEARCRNRYEMAEYLDVTEEYLEEAIDCYKAKYGLYASVDNYIIYFEPFAVIKFVATE